VNVWTQILGQLRAEMPEEDFRRWFGATSFASDSGDQITIWVPSEAIRRHIDRTYQEQITRTLRSLGRGGSHVRLLVGGLGDEDDDEG
jgi:chromosomal replication initiation ATPase DnaA